jgi:hypothetical protein
MKGAEESRIGSAVTAVFGPRSRREFLLGATAVGSAGVLHGDDAAAQDEKKTFTILHTNLVFHRVTAHWSVVHSPVAPAELRS